MKAVLLLALVMSAIRCYEVEEEVLILHDSDFPGILEEFPNILIKFYAPWCGHCKRMAPAYAEAAQELAAKGSNIKLAKVDATKETTSPGEYGVAGYPTIFFFMNGNKIDFTGERSKEGIISWVEKKVLPATTEVSTQEELDNLQEQDAVHLVLFSEDESELSDFKAQAAGDDYNKYFIATGDLIKKYGEGTVEIIRNFGKVLTFKGLGDGFSNWVNKHSRPLVLNFDDRTIKDIFQKQKNAIVLFNKENSQELVSLLNEASEKYEGDTLFVDITPDNEHFSRFAEFIKLDVENPRLIGLASRQQKKAVYSGDASELTADSLLAFVESVDGGSATFVGLQDAVPSDQAAAEEAAEENAEAAEENAEAAEEAAEAAEEAAEATEENAEAAEEAAEAAEEAAEEL